MPQGNETNFCKRINKFNQNTATAKKAGPPLVRLRRQIKAVVNATDDDR